MKIGIIDAELIDGGNHRFPNLACMKLASFFKDKGDEVELLTKYTPTIQWEPNTIFARDQLAYDKVFLSCVFTDTASKIPSIITNHPQVMVGGTGFFFDKYNDAPMLDQIAPGIEHSTPDYTLYDQFFADKANETNRKHYQGFSIGFLTRGCFRRCKFCVLQSSKTVDLHSPLLEIVDPARPNNDLCFLDDNILGLGIKGGEHRAELIRILEEVNEFTDKHKSRYCFNQGMDIRIMRPEYAQVFAKARYWDDFIFAFDNIKDKTTVCRGLEVFREAVPVHNIRLYVLCGFFGQDVSDIVSVFERLEVLWKFRATGYLMRHEKCAAATTDPVIRHMYVSLARWCNQTQFQKTLTFRVFCNKTGNKAARTIQQFQDKYPEVAERFFDMAFPDSRYHPSVGEVDEFTNRDFLKEYTQAKRDKQDAENKKEEDSADWLYRDSYFSSPAESLPATMTDESPTRDIGLVDADFADCGDEDKDESVVPVSLTISAKPQIPSASEFPSTLF